MPAPIEDEDRSINTVWASAKPAGEGELQTLPSGQVVYAKKVGLQTLLEAGVLAEADSLTGLIGSQHLSHNQPADVVKIAMRDPQAFGALLMMIDRALPLIVVKPQVTLHFTTDDNGKTELIPVDDREPGIYTDQIDLSDKIYLLNFAVGDLTRLAQFRSESQAALATVGNGEDVPRSPKRAPRDKPKRRR